MHCCSRQMKRDFTEENELHCSLFMQMCAKEGKKNYTCKQEESADTNTPPMVLLMVLRSERRIS